MTGLDVFLDPLFRLPLIAGLLVSAVLPLLGVLLRVRDEWLAALGLAHLAAAGGLLAVAAGAPLVAGAVAGAVSGALAKGVFSARGNTAYGLMILAGWSAALLVAASTPLGAAHGHALAEGQLYFARWPQVLAGALALATTVAAWRWLSPRLVRARLFPLHDRANRLPAWRWHLGFDLLTALALAAGTATVGLMGAFALAFVPPWAAFRLAPGWREATLISVALGVGSYLAAFAVAAALDLPFGPVLVAALLLTASGARAYGAPPPTASTGA
jgi:zinc transport system permease protein